MGSLALLRGVAQFLDRIAMLFNCSGLSCDRISPFLNDMSLLCDCSGWFLDCIGMSCDRSPMQLNVAIPTREGDRVKRPLGF
jgi:hypothetical protein